jgi:hypothetical protein
MLVMPDSAYGVCFQALAHMSTSNAASVLLVMTTQGPSSRQALGRALYGAVLHALPASARTWFGDLRDRGVAAALEVGGSIGSRQCMHCALGACWPSLLPGCMLQAAANCTRCHAVLLCLLFCLTPPCPLPPLTWVYSCYSDFPASLLSFAGVHVRT